MPPVLTACLIILMIHAHMLHFEQTYKNAFGQGTFLFGIASPDRIYQTFPFNLLIRLSFVLPISHFHNNFIITGSLPSQVTYSIVSYIRYFIAEFKYL